MRAAASAVTLERLSLKRLADYYEIDITEEQHAFVGMHRTRLIRRMLLSLGKCRILLICRDGEVCGYLCLWIDPKIDQFTIAPFIIDRRFQRQGVGRKALKLACEKLFEAGAEKVRLAVRPGNDGAAVFYEQEGFRFTGDIWGEADRVMALEQERSCFQKSRV